MHSGIPGHWRQIVRSTIRSVFPSIHSRTFALTLIREYEGLFSFSLKEAHTISHPLQPTQSVVNLENLTSPGSGVEFRHSSQGVGEITGYLVLPMTGETTQICLGDFSIFTILAPSAFPCRSLFLWAYLIFQLTLKLLVPQKLACLRRQLEPVQEPLHLSSSRGSF
jgi:hypothetical protein